MNTSHKPFDDVRVRQAINYAINVDTIVKGVLKGLGIPADNLVAPGVVGYYPIPNYHRYDPAKAKQLLADAGYASGFKTSVLMGEGRYFLLKEILTVVQAQLKDVGIDMEIKPMEWNSYLAELRKSQAEIKMEMNAWAWSTPTGDIQYIFDSNLTAAALAPARWNFMFWNDKKFNDAVAGAQTESDPVKRFELIKTAQQIVADQVPQISLIVYGQATVRSAKVHDVIFPPTEEFYLGSAWIVK
jgi:peptide/nickel transport system substrate-binding protein